MHVRRMVLPKIRVRMFGDFSISINDRTMSNFKGNTKRVWLLVQYLLVHRNEDVSIDTLVSDLWNGNLSGDPKNALKNLVYRARTLLRELAGSDRLQFIEFVGDTYRWNNRYECEIDSEQFLELFRKGENSGADAQQRVDFYRRAAELYTGTFLEKSSYDRWVLQKSGEYAEVYRKCVKNLCEILFSMRRYVEAGAVCETALQRQSYEVVFYRLLLQACVGGGKRSEALSYYTQAKELFARKFHVDISGALQPFYSQLINGGGSVETSLEEIKSDLREQESGGAFFCDYDLFRAIYRLQMRAERRTGVKAFLALFSVTAPPEGEDAGNALYRAAGKLREAVVSTLRAADVVTSYSSVQFLAILSSASYEDAAGVVERVKKSFRFSCRSGGVEMRAELSPVD